MWELINQQLWRRRVPIQSPAALAENVHHSSGGWTISVLCIWRQGLIQQRRNQTWKNDRNWHKRRKSDFNILFTLHSVYVFVILHEYAKYDDRSIVGRNFHSLIACVTITIIKLSRVAATKLKFTKFSLCDVVTIGFSPWWIQGQNSVRSHMYSLSTDFIVFHEKRIRVSPSFLNLRFIVIWPVPVNPTNLFQSIIGTPFRNVRINFRRCRATLKYVPEIHEVITERISGSLSNPKVRSSYPVGDVWRPYRHAYYFEILHGEDLHAYLLLDLQ